MVNKKYLIILLIISSIFVAGCLEYVNFQNPEKQFVAMIGEDIVFTEGEDIIEVIVKEGYGEYIEFTGGRSRTSKNIGSFVGRKQKTPLIWYSFPFGGKWDLVRKIGSLPLSEVYTCLDSQQKSREEMTDEEEIILIEDLIAQKYPDS